MMTKKSNLEWLGEIPSHWDLVKLGHISSIIDCGYTSTPEYVDKEEGVIFLSGQNVKKGKLDLWKHNYIKPELHKELTKNRKPEKGDMLVVRVGGSSNIGMSCVVEDDFEFSIYVSLTHLRIKKKYGTPYFFNHLFNWDKFREFCNVETKVGGGVGNLNVKDFERFKLPVPPLSEQQQIVSFLDTKTSLIDSLIEKTEQKIELLKEKRTSLINEVVTKGLNPNVEMKDSGVEWIGEIPCHWIVKKIKHLFRHTKGQNGQKLTKEYIGENEGEYPVYSGSTKGNGELGRVNEYEFDMREESVIFVSTVGSDTTVMSTRILSGKFNLSQNCLIMSKIIEVNIRFVYFFTLMDFPYQRSLLPVILKEGHRSVGMGELDEFQVLFPPHSEQNEIVSYLDEHTQLIDKTISIEEKRIELLKEYRQSLISEVVTGKRKVVE